MNEMYHITADRQKRKYGYISNLVYYMKSIWEWDKKMFFAQMLLVFPMTASSLLGNIMPAQLVTGLERHNTLTQIISSLLLIGAAMLICAVMSSMMETVYTVQEDYFPLHFMKKYVSKIMQVDYARMEEAEYKLVMDNTWSAARSGRGIVDAIYYIPDLLIYGVMTIVYGIMMARQSMVLLLLGILSIGVSLYLLSVARKMHGKYFSKISKYAKGEEYITEQCMDSAAGKDIRIYHMLDFILEKYDENLHAIGGLFDKIHCWYLFRNVAGAVLEFARDSFAFLFLIYKMVQGEMSAAGFVFYIGVISSFSQAFEAFIRALMSVNSINTSMSYIREFDEEDSIWRKDSVIGKEGMEEMRRHAVKLELEDVSFTYPGSAKPTISHLNLTIQQGEKLALIGLNGAGKTTLVKLICGFYFPQEGRIKINDVAMDSFTKEEYISLLSVLFQDTTLLPRSVEENIVSGAEYNQGRLKKVLELSGFLEKYENLPQKGATKLVKKLEKTAVDFSGGEKQKLLFARALYKEAPLVILDEPTAALDPIAENELYMHFGAAMKDRTSIYISHRLSSTRFCDRIILLEGGRIVEEGTHDELMEAQGRYANLYEMQSQYYKEEENKKKKSEVFGDDYVELEKGGIFDE